MGNRGRINYEVVINIYIILYIKRIIKKDILYSIGDYSIILLFYNNLYGKII